MILVIITWLIVGFIGMLYSIRQFNLALNRKFPTVARPLNFLGFFDLGDHVECVFGSILGPLAIPIGSSIGKKIIGKEYW